MPHEQLRILVAGHGLIPVLRGLAEVCSEHAGKGNRPVWQMGSLAIGQALQYLNNLIGVPGITEPLSDSPVEASRSPVEAGPDSGGNP